MSDTHFDIIIVGAGLVGTSLVSALAKLGLRIAVLEQHVLDVSVTPSAHGRPISLSHSSHTALKKLGIWDALAEHACPIEAVHVSEQGAFGRLYISAEEYQLPALGYVVPFDILRHALYQSAAAVPNTNIQCITTLKSIQNTEHGTEVVFQAGDHEHCYQCDLLVAADGAHSQTRQLLGIDVVEDDHHEHALTATLTLDTQLNTGYERFTPEGIVAVLPRPNQTAGLVWSIKEPMIDTVKEWDDHTLINYIQQALGQRIGTITALKRNALYPLVTRTASTQYRDHAVLLGNSAHTFYPIAAQGFNLSLRDATQLAEVIRFAHSSSTLTDPKLLPTYMHLRKDDQKHVQRMINTTAFCFDLNIPALRSLRGAGLMATQLLKPLKQRLAKRSLGQTGRIQTVRAFYGD